MSLAFVTAVYNWLAADSGSGGFANGTGGVGSSLYHVSGPEDVNVYDGPVCVFTITGAADPVRSFNGTSSEEWRMSFSIWRVMDAAANNGPAAALAVDALLFARLEGASLAATGYDRCLCRCIARGAVSIDEDCYRIDSDYTLVGQRTS